MPNDGTGLVTGVDPPISAVREAVRRAIAEDVLPLGDVSASLIPPERRGTFAFVARRSGVVAGRVCAMEALGEIDREIRAEWLKPDGSRVGPGDAIGVVTGRVAAIVTAERTALNFLCHLSGVATATRAFVDVVTAANPDTRVLDTRKTTPGLRAVEKAAVRAGGGNNHRGNLSEAVLVKDNHVAGIGITAAVERARRMWVGRMIEVEADTRDQVAEAVDAGATVVMLDNMDPDEVAGCVRLVAERGARERVLLEVSGGVSLESAPEYAKAGVDVISVGAITHSAPALDIGLDVVEIIGDTERG